MIEAKKKMVLDHIHPITYHIIMHQTNSIGCALTLQAEFVKMS